MQIEWMQGNSAGAHAAPVSKVLLHTTEGGSIEGACAAYVTNNSWPHLTIDCRFGRTQRVCGHLTYDVAARSLKNLPGGVQTNTAGVVQIEVVGKAAEPNAIDWAWLGREFVGPICRQFGIPIQSTVDWVWYPNSYGQNAKQRLSPQAWLAYRGVLGHQHAPENAHGDPGAIDIDALLAAAAGTEPPQEDDMPRRSNPLIEATGVDGAPQGAVFVTDGNLVSFTWVPDEDTLGNVKYLLRQNGERDTLQKVDDVRAFGSLVGPEPPGWPEGWRRSADVPDAG